MKIPPPSPLCIPTAFRTTSPASHLHHSMSRSQSALITMDIALACQPLLPLSPPLLSSPLSRPNLKAPPRPAPPRAAPSAAPYAKLGGGGVERAESGSEIGHRAREPVTDRSSQRGDDPTGWSDILTCQPPPRPPASRRE